MRKWAKWEYIVVQKCSRATRALSPTRRWRWWRRQRWEPTPELSGAQYQRSAHSQRCQLLAIRFRVPHRPSLCVQ
jgi:hypothetical protein